MLLNLARRNKRCRVYTSIKLVRDSNRRPWSTVVNQKALELEKRLYICQRGEELSQPQKSLALSSGQRNGVGRDIGLSHMTYLSLCLLRFSGVQIKSHLLEGRCLRRLYQASQHQTASFPPDGITEFRCHWPISSKLSANIQTKQQRDCTLIMCDTGDLPSLSLALQKCIRLSLQ